MVEEMKKMYGTEIGSHKIIIKCISDVAIRMPTKIMAFKLLRNFHKEEAHVRVVTVVVQCAEGVVLS
jgi:hypothetical protein